MSESMSGRSRILIVTNGHLCRNPRPLKEATTLGNAGYDVTILTVRNHPASEPIDAEILRTAPFRQTSVDVLRGFDTPGAVVWTRRGRQWLARQATVRLGVSTMESLGPASALLRRASRHAADLTIVHNEVPHWVGVQLLARGRRVAADIEDWHSEDLLPEERGGRPLALLRDAERTLLQRATYTSTTSHALAGALHARYGGVAPVVISNSFSLQSKPHAKPPGEPPSFFWFSQTIGPGRGLEQFLSAWQLTHQPSRVVLLGRPRAGYVDDLLAPLPCDKRASVTLLPLVSPMELPGVIARHDIGLALEQTSVLSRDLTITNKILQYLNAGLAIVASDTAGQREVLAREPKAGAIVDFSDPASLAQRLDALLMDRAALVAQKNAARQLAERTYCWEREAPQLLALVGQALRGLSFAPAPTAT